MVSVQREKYEVDFPVFAAPSHVGEFSVDRDGKMVNGSENLRHLYHEPLGQNRLEFDLNQGFAIFDCKDELSNGGLDTLLDWIRLHGAGKKSLKEAVHGADFVCWRGTLTRIAATPYEEREGWRMVIVRFADVIFICEVKTPEKRLAIENETRRQKLMSYWGFKFEQYMTLETDHQVSSIDH